VSAYPTVVDPFRWYGVVETPGFFALASVDSRSPEVDPEGTMDIRYKPEETPMTLAAKKSYAGRAFLDWAKYPVTETEPLEDSGYVVRFQDLRYLQMPGPLRRNDGHRTLGMAVKLDRNLRVVGDVYGDGEKQVVEADRGEN
jgi:inner membrane protein